MLTPDNFKLKSILYNIIKPGLAPAGDNNKLSSLLPYLSQDYGTVDIQWSEHRKAAMCIEGKIGSKKRKGQ